MANAKTLFSTEPGSTADPGSITIDGLSEEAMAAVRKAIAGLVNTDTMAQHTPAILVGAQAAYDTPEAAAVRKFVGDCETAAMMCNKTVIMATLAAYASGATVEYAGSGDSGGVEDLAVDNKSVLAVQVPRVHVARWFHSGSGFAISMVTMPLQQALCEFTEGDLLDHFGHSGYENNEGGFGTVTFKPEGLLGEGSITLEHSDYIQETENYEHVL